MAMTNYKIIYSNELYHHGILGQKWGQRNGPPYPLDASDHSASEKKAGWRKSLETKKEIKKQKREYKESGKEITKALRSTDKEYKVTTVREYTARSMSNEEMASIIELRNQMRAIIKQMPSGDFYNRLENEALKIASERLKNVTNEEYEYRITSETSKAEQELLKSKYPKEYVLEQKFDKAFNEYYDHIKKLSDTILSRTEVYKNFDPNKHGDIQRYVTASIYASANNEIYDKLLTMR